MSDIPTGWQCPVCKRVYSPSVDTCPFCGGNTDKPKPLDPLKPLDPYVLPFDSPYVPPYTSPHSPWVVRYPIVYC